MFEGYETASAHPHTTPAYLPASIHPALCRGVKEVFGTKIILPDSPGKQRTPYQKQKLRKGFKRRAAIGTQLNDKSFLTSGSTLSFRQQKSILAR